MSPEDAVILGTVLGTIIAAVYRGVQGMRKGHPTGELAGGNDAEATSTEKRISELAKGMVTLSNDMRRLEREVGKLTAHQADTADKLDRLDPWLHETLGEIKGILGRR
ncbi:hypothetical protein [Tropicimonas sp. IMCC34011]|uniref:hypothetical protein n=1 Tax=Tropicimonas sp. IMCC34011 TaxID=2248759 RepID=UPI000E26FEB7|nr:hypothetical protein [Tropicimonas sp. IMCC34011]